MNKELANFCKQLKKDFKPKNQNTKKPVSCWSEKDILNKKIVNAFVIIFKTQGCTWALESGCSMCGYFNDSIWRKIPDTDLLEQYKSAMEKHTDQKFVKIFTSGSFLDDKEIKPQVRNKILTSLYEKVDKVSVESRPEYITEKKINEIKKIAGTKKFEVGIGLETSNDQIRENSINKGFTFNDYKKVAKLLKKHEMGVKTYVLVKPPFITEKQAINDAINTIKDIKNLTDIVSFNPVNIQRNTLVSYLWKRKQYRPPWLFSLVEILRESKKITENILLKCDIVAGGKTRGAHNCRNCDYSFIKAISEFSLSQDEKVFKDLKCECHEKWLDQLDLEDLGFGSLANMYG